MNKEATYTIEILNEYRRIAKENVSRKVAFYRQNEALLTYVSLNRKIDIILDYQLALFELGHYNEYLYRCDKVIEALFDSSLFPMFRKSDVKKLLFHKAGSQLNLHQLDESQNTMNVLIRMDTPNNNLYHGLLFQIFKTKRLLLRFQARGIVIAMILCSALLSIWTVIFIKPIYPESMIIFQAWTIGLFTIGALIWISFIVYNNVSAYAEVKAFIKKSELDSIS